MSSKNEYALPNGVNVATAEFFAGAKVVLESWSGEPFDCVIEEDSYIMFNRDGSIYDIAGNMETAINYTDALDGVAGYAVSQDMEEQARLNREYALQIDLYGLEG